MSGLVWMSARPLATSSRSISSGAATIQPRRHPRNRIVENDPVSMTTPATPSALTPAARPDAPLIEPPPRVEVEPLLPAVDDQDLRGAHLEPEAQQVAGQELPERRLAAPRMVREELPCLLGNGPVEHAPEPVGGEEPAG